MKLSVGNLIMYSPRPHGSGVQIGTVSRVSKDTFGLDVIYDTAYNLGVHTNVIAWREKTKVKIFGNKKEMEDYIFLLGI